MAAIDFEGEISGPAGAANFMLKKVLIGGVDVSNYVLPFKLDLSFGDTTHQLELRLAYTVKDVVTLSNSLRVEVWRGFTTSTDEKIFDGFVTAYELSGIMYLLTCNDMLGYAAVGSEVNYNYNSTTDIYAGVASELARDVICKWAGLYAGPYTIDSTTVACWSMQYAKNIQDSTVNRITSNVNTALTLTTGLYGGAVTFDGAASKALFNVVTEMELADFTVEAYIKINSKSAATVIANSKAAGGADSGWNLGTAAGGEVTLTVANSGGTATATGATAMSTGTWYHIAGTYDGEVLNVYLDGAFDGTSALVGPAAYSGCSLCMGANVSAAYFNGIIDDCRVSNVVKDSFSYTDSVISSSALPDIPSLKCQRTNPLDLLNALEDNIGYQCYFLPNEGRVYFEPKGYVNTEINLTIGGASANVAQVPSWNEDTNGMANVITLRGFQGLVHTSESFAGPGTSFSLSYSPFNMKVTVGGVLKVGGGFTGAGAVINDYAVDPMKQLLAFKVSSSTVVADYDYQANIALTQQDNLSVATYGPKPKTFTDTSIVTLPAAIARMNQLLSYYANPFLNTELKLPVWTLPTVKVGQIIHVDDDVNLKDGNFLITDHIIEWPSLYDTIRVGNKEWETADWGTNIEKKLQSLQQQISGNETYTAHGMSCGKPQRGRRKSLTASGWNPGRTWIWDSMLDNNNKWDNACQWDKDTTYSPAVLYNIDYY